MSARLRLAIGNKNYSSWSMRPWVLMKQAGIEFDELMLRFDSFGADSHFKRVLARYSPAGRVPVLLDGGLAIWDSLAIAEYLAEIFPERQLWPAQPQARARARSVCAEMHAGFGALREHLPMNIEATLPEVGERILREHATVRADLDRILSMWAALLEASGGPLLFGSFSIADAFYAPVVMRLRCYGIALPAPARAYADAIVALPGVAAWISDALLEHDFRPFEEPYRSGPSAKPG